MNAKANNGSVQALNLKNKVKTLKLIRQRDGISRAEIAKDAGLSPSTVTRIVDSLVNEERLVVEVGAGISSGGRRPTRLQFAGAENYVIGIDLGTTQIMAALVNLNAEIIQEVQVETRASRNFETVMSDIGEIIQTLKSNPVITGRNLFGIGIAVPGLVTRRRNIVEYSPNFNWHNVDIRTALKKQCDLPIIIGNVTRVMALGEKFFGIGQNYQNFVVLNVGYGIGAGIIVDGQPVYGKRGMAGEIGHVPLEYDSDLKCACGRFGCLEALASGRAIAKAAVDGIAAGISSDLLTRANGNPDLITTKLVAKAASNGDAFSNELLEKAANYLGVGVAILMNLFAPEVVILGGGVTESGPVLLNKVRKVALAKAMQDITDGVNIQLATFGKNAALMGAISLVLNDILNLNIRSTS